MLVQRNTIVRKTERVEAEGIMAGIGRRVGFR